MNTSETIAMLTDRDPSTDEYRIPHIIYSDAFYSETVAYADLVLPDTTYLERWDCISLHDRPICSAHAVSDSIRTPVLKLDRDVRPFQDVLIELGTMVGLPGLTTDDGAPRYPGGYADFIVNHEFKPGCGLLAGRRGKRGDRDGRGAVNPNQLEDYVANQCFWTRELAPEQRYLRHANKDYLDYAVEMGFVSDAEPVVFQLYSEVLQRFRLAARGHGTVQPPESQRERVERYFDPLPFWYAPLEEDTIDTAAYPLHAITQRPMAMYHSWGSQNAWLRQIHGSNRLYIAHDLADVQGIRDDDWVWIISRVGKVRAQVQVMNGVNAGTVWTWNAIGKRKGAWNLQGDTKETEIGFLLNHLIGDSLPVDGSNATVSNSDPVTGQAAWYDLRVRIEKVLDKSICRTAPQFHVIATPDCLKKPPTELRYGEEFRNSGNRDKS